MAPVESLYARTSYSQIPHRDEILTMLKWARIHTPIHEISILKDGRFVMHIDGFGSLIGIDGKEVMRLIEAPRDKGKITLFDLLVGIGFYPREIRKWNCAYTRHLRNSGISEDAISVILFYFAHMVRLDDVSGKASILCQIIRQFGIRPFLETICTRASVRFFPGNSSPEPLEQEMLMYISLTNTLGKKMSTSIIAQFVKESTGIDPCSDDHMSNISWETIADCKPINTKLRTNDLWFDREMRSYISLYGISVLTGLKRDKVERTLLSLYGPGHGIGGAINNLSRLYLPKEHIDKWIEIGVVPGDLLPDLARAFSSGENGSIARRTASLIEEHGTHRFLLSRSVFGLIGDRVIVPMPNKAKHEHYMQVYTIRSMGKGSSYERPVSTRTLWMDEDGKYRMSWRGIAILIGSCEATLKKLFNNGSETNEPSIRQELYDMGYEYADIDSMLKPRVGVPEEAIVLIVRHYCAKRKVNTVRALALLIAIEENGIKDILSKAVVKIRSRDGDYVPVSRSKKKEEILAPLKYGDID